MTRLVTALAVVVLLIAGIVWADNPHNLPAAPVIVAQSDNVGQTTAIPPTTLFTPTVDGDYRLSIYLEDSPGVGNALCASWSWTDDYASRGDLFDIGINATSQFGGTIRVLRVKAGTPVVIQIVDNAPQGCVIPPNYGAFFTLEKL